MKISKTKNRWAFWTSCGLLLMACIFEVSDIMSYKTTIAIEFGIFMICGILTLWWAHSNDIDLFTKTDIFINGDTNKK